MEYATLEDGRFHLLVSPDEVLTLRHCVIEALEAVGEAEFLIRTGATKGEAEALLDVLISISQGFAAE